MTTASAVTCEACQSVIGRDDLFCEACGSDVPGGIGSPRTGSGTSCAVCGAALGEMRPEYCLGCGTRQPSARDHLEADLHCVAAASDRGRRHSRNEDAFAISVAPDGRILAVVCDGVSTTARPDEASRAAADAGLAALLGAPGASSGADLEAAYLAARHAVRAIPEEAEELRTGAPSCTFLAAVVNGGGVRVASMGDSRAFWLPQAGEPLILTADDSWAAEQILAGAMTTEAAQGDPRSHSITRWLGRDAEPCWRPHDVAFSPQSPGRLVLCTDGLWNYADSATRLASIMPPGSPCSAARSLVAWANAQGGQDNVTVVVLDVGPPDDVGHAQQKGPAR